MGERSAVAEAESVLAENRRDRYTIPSPELYPYQWNWDSGFIAIGLSAVDPAAATAELVRLFEGTWPSGLLPHILFHDESAEGYFPGPEEWDVRVDGVATSGITQPPVAVTAVRRVYERAGDDEFLSAVLPMVRDHMSWWVRERSFDGAAVYLRHPWESGMDDSPSWDDPLAAMEPDDISYERADLDDESLAEQRPTDWYYDRYVSLVRQGRRHDWDEATLRERCPFLVEDVLTNSVFVRACEDLAALLETVDDTDAAERWRIQADRTRTAMQERHWNDDLGMFVSYDRVNNRQLVEPSVAGLLPTFGSVPTDDQLDRLLTTLSERFLSFDYAAPTYVGENMNPDRYWRGPVWLNTNWLLERGLRPIAPEAADRVRADSLDLVETAGFHEYFKPTTGAGRGSGRFSWSAALYLDWTEDGS